MICVSVYAIDGSSPECNKVYLKGDVIIKATNLVSKIIFLKCSPLTTYLPAGFLFPVMRCAAGRLSCK